MAGSDPPHLSGRIDDQRDLNVARVVEPDADDPSGSNVYRARGPQRPWAGLPGLVWPDGGSKRGGLRIDGDSGARSPDVVHLNLDRLHSHGGRTYGTWPAAFEAQWRGLHGWRSGRRMRVAQWYVRPNPASRGTCSCAENTCVGLRCSRRGVHRLAHPVLARTHCCRPRARRGRRLAAGCTRRTRSACARAGPAASRRGAGGQTVCRRVRPA